MSRVLPTMPKEISWLLYHQSLSDTIREQLILKSVPYVSGSEEYNRRYEDIIFLYDEGRIKTATFLNRTHWGCRECDGTSVILAGGDLIPCTSNPNM